MASAFGPCRSRRLDTYRIAEDIKTSVSFIRTLDQVDVNNVFNMGICAGSGFSAFATAYGGRVKGVVMVSPYLTTADEFLNCHKGKARLMNHRADTTILILRSSGTRAVMLNNTTRVSKNPTII